MVLNSSTAHPHIQNVSIIKICFLPLNTTSISQPMLFKGLPSMGKFITGNGWYKIHQMCRRNKRKNIHFRYYLIDILCLEKCHRLHNLKQLPPHWFWFWISQWQFQLSRMHWEWYRPKWSCFLDWLSSCDFRAFGRYWYLKVSKFKHFIFGRKKPKKVLKKKKM